MTTIGELLRQGFARIDRYDARLLLCHVLECTKESLITKQNCVVDPESVDRYLQAIEQAADGYPVPYILGYHGFWNRSFHVTPDVLIPRPDTETLVENVLSLLDDSAAPRILEMGVGSGCIAVTLALELPDAHVVATDISEKALVVAQANARRLGADNITFLCGSWYEPVEDLFDIIVSNPPYIEPDDEHLPALRYEPLGALTDGVDGLSDIRTIAHGAAEHLRPGGYLVVEHGYDQGEAVRAIFESNAFQGVRTVKDLGQNDRITIGHR